MTDAAHAAHAVDALMQARFRSGDPRSAEYKAGVRAVLELKFKGELIKLPFAMGTAQADAFCDGLDEGMRIWRVALDEAGA